MFKNIRFNPYSICSCSTNCTGPYISINKITNIDKKLFAEEYNKAITNAFNEFKSGNIPSCCSGCYNLLNRENNQPQNHSTKIKRIDISHWKNCNIECIYCVFKDEKKVKKIYDIKSFYPFLEKNIDENAQILIGGGEPIILPEIKSILKYFSKISTCNIFLMSNMTKFLNEYIPLLKSGKLNINISLDSGNRELYKKIKKKDKYNTVLGNIKKAIKYAKNKEQILVKYIIVEGVNDKKTDINDFLDVCQKLGIINTKIEFNREEKNRGKKIPLQTIELYNFAKLKAESIGLNILPDDRVFHSLETQSYL